LQSKIIRVASPSNNLSSKINLPKMEKIDWSVVKPKLNPKNNLPTILITEPDQNGNQQLISNEQGDKHREISPTN